MPATEFTGVLDKEDDEEDPSGCQGSQKKSSKDERRSLT
jgi:hypothetical protein